MRKYGTNISRRLRDTLNDVNNFKKSQFIRKDIYSNPDNEITNVKMSCLRSAWHSMSVVLFNFHFCWYGHMIGPCDRQIVTFKIYKTFAHRENYKSSYLQKNYFYINIIHRPNFFDKQSLYIPFSRLAAVLDLLWLHSVTYNTSDLITFILHPLILASPMKRKV